MKIRRGDVLKKKQIKKKLLSRKKNHTSLQLISTNLLPQRQQLKKVTLRRSLRVRKKKTNRKSKIERWWKNITEIGTIVSSRLSWSKTRRENRISKRLSLKKRRGKINLKRILDLSMCKANLWRSLNQWLLSKKCYQSTYLKRKKRLKEETA